MPLSQPILVRTLSWLKGVRLHQTCVLRSNNHEQARSFHSSIAPPWHRQGFHTTAPKNAAHDSSTIDHVLMPQYEQLRDTPPEIMRIPLLPTNFFPSRRSAAHQEAVEPVIRPEISTVSADSTHIASPSAMSEVTDNHAIELDPYDLTAIVNAAAKKMTELPAEKLKEVGVLRELWLGLLDDLLGKKVGRA